MIRYCLRELLDLRLGHGDAFTPLIVFSTHSTSCTFGVACLGRPDSFVISLALFNSPSDVPGLLADFFFGSFSAYALRFFLFLEG